MTDHQQGQPCAICADPALRGGSVCNDCMDDAALGLVDGSPRAVPLDAVVSVLTTVVDGGVLARVVLPLTLAVAAWGVTVLVRPLGGTAQVAAATLTVWNAYVVERLALGQWALLLAYAAVPRWRSVRHRPSAFGCAHMTSGSGWPAMRKWIALRPG